MKFTKLEAAPNLALGYTKREAAAALRLSLRSLDTLLKSGDPPPHTRFGKKLFFPAAPLADWIAQRTIVGNHQAV
jgi:hypothetical protein